MGKGDRKTRKGKRFVRSRKKRTKLNCYGIIPKTYKKIMDYKQEMDYAIKNNIAQFGDIFDFDGVPNEKLYKDLYSFCRENLDIHFKRKSILHGSFLYSNDFNVNARARTKDNQSTILFNIGLMHNCMKKYLFNHALNDFIELKEPDLNSKFDTPLSHLAFQITTQFTYYHELAHLIQFSQTAGEEELQERSSEGEFDIKKHKLEINADTYSSICITTHIYQYILKSFGDNINQENVTKTLTLLGTCLLEYILNFTDKFEFYFEEYSHPHPLIRLLNIILSLTSHFSEFPLFIEKGIKLEPISLFRSIIDFHKELEDNKIFTTGFSNFTSQYAANKDKIVSYFSKIKDLGDDNDYTDAVSVWNSHIHTTD